MKEIQALPDFKLQIIATGTHLAPEFGLTYKEIENDGFGIDRKVEMLISGDTSSAAAKSMGLAVIGIGEALEHLAPDLLVILGDRYEILAAASAALVHRIPMAHIHGGETTEGAFDDAIRHALTKMSHLHFAATEEYRARIVRMGEDPARVFSVGGLGVDGIKKVDLLSREALEKSLEFQLGRRNLLITFHPATLDAGSPEEQAAELLGALGELEDVRFIFTLPNADPGGRAIAGLIHDFTAARPHAKAFASLGQLRYWSCLKYVDGIVGNSSSGLLEAPSFQIGTINIGVRQSGRVKADSVIDCEASSESIRGALVTLYSNDFQQSLKHAKNPYGSGDASQKIAEVLGKTEFKSLLVKKFYEAAH